MVWTNYLELVEDLVHSRNRVRPAGAHPRTKGGLRRSVQQQGQPLIPNDGKAITARTDDHNTAFIQYSSSITLPQKRLQRSRANTNLGVDMPHSDSSNDRARNPTLTCDDSDDVRTKTTHRAWQGSNAPKTSDDSDDVLTQTTHRARVRQGVEPVNDKRR